MCGYPLRASAIATLILGAAMSGCGGSGVDPEFTGPLRTLPADSSASPFIDTTAPTTFSRPKLVEIRADWCRFCRAAQPALDEAYDPFQTKVDLVVLDVTNDATIAQSERIAAHEGVRKFFAQYQGRTPTVGVFIGPEEGRVVHGSLEEPNTFSRELAFAVREYLQRAGSEQQRAPVE